MRDLVLELERTDARDQRRLIAVAAAEGAPAAIKEACRLLPDPEKRRAALAGAASPLVELRLYEQALALVLEGAKGAPNASAWQQWAALLKKVRRFDRLPMAPGDPATPIRRFFQVVLTPARHDMAKIRALFTTEVGEAAFGDENARKFAAGFREAMRRREGAESILSAPIPESTVDLTVSALRFTPEGDGNSGYRVRVEAPAGAGSRVQTYFVAREGKELKLVALSSAFGGMGLEALRRAGAGDLDGARRWLDWAREEIPSGGGDDPFATEPFPALWTRGQRGDARAVRIAAAALCAKDAPDRAVPVLEAEREHAGPEVRIRIDQAIAHAYFEREEWPKALEPAERAVAAWPDSVLAAACLCMAHLASHESEKAEKAVLAVLERRSGDPLALTFLGAVYAERGDFERAEATWRGLAESGRASPIAYSGLATLALFRGGAIGEEEIDLARRGSADGRSSSLATLALAYASAGKTAAALDALYKSMEASGGDEPDSEHWLVLGRLAEEYCERDAAIAAYRRVRPKPTETWARNLRDDQFAKVRLAALEAH